VSLLRVFRAPLVRRPTASSTNSITRFSRYWGQSITALVVVYRRVLFKICYQRLSYLQLVFFFVMGFRKMHGIRKAVIIPLFDLLKN
jgi:hypothetical protein